MVHGGQDGVKGDQDRGAERESRRREKAGRYSDLQAIGKTWIFSLSEEEGYYWRDLSRGAMWSHFCFQRITF